MTIVVDKTITDLQKLIVDVKQQLNDSSEPAWQKPNGVTYSSGKEVNKIAFVFPGQGSQYVGYVSRSGLSVSTIFYGT